MTEDNRTDFEVFKDEFTYWQARFGLTGYKVYFKYEPIENAWADIDVIHVDRVVTVRLDSEVTDEGRLQRDVKSSAKHEAIHLLLMELQHLTGERYIREDEIYAAVESIVFKLEGLIQ